MAVLPGKREIGVYLGFDASAGFTPDKVVLSGANANFLAWAGPFRRENGDLAEEHPEAQRPLTLVAVGERGVLFSLGSFDTAPFQVAFILQDVAPSTSYTAAFYVNGTP